MMRSNDSQREVLTARHAALTYRIDQRGSGHRSSVLLQQLRDQITNKLLRLELAQNCSTFIAVDAEVEQLRCRGIRKGFRE